MHGDRVALSSGSQLARRRSPGPRAEDSSAGDGQDGVRNGLFELPARSASKDDPLLALRAGNSNACAGRSLIDFRELSEPIEQALGQHGRTKTPAPVARWSAWVIHSCLIAEAEYILQGRDGIVGDRRPCHADQIPRRIAVGTRRVTAEETKFIVGQ